MSIWLWRAFPGRTLKSFTHCTIVYLCICGASLCFIMVYEKCWKVTSNFSWCQTSSLHKVVLCLFFQFGPFLSFIYLALVIFPYNCGSSVSRFLSYFWKYSFSLMWPFISISRTSMWLGVLEIIPFNRLTAKFCILISYWSSSISIEVLQWSDILDYASAARLQRYLRCLPSWFLEHCGESIYTMRSGIEANKNAASALSVLKSRQSLFLSAKQYGLWVDKRQRRWNVGERHFQIMTVFIPEQLLFRLPINTIASFVCDPHY